MDFLRTMRMDFWHGRAHDSTNYWAVTDRVFDPGRWRIRGPPLNNLRLLLRGWRQQAVEAEVHGGGAVMVGPVVGEGDQCESPWCFAAAPELNRIAQLGVRYFRHRSVAEVELSLGLRDVASLGAEVVVRFRHVQDQVGKAHLLRRGFVTESIRRHLLDGSDQVFLLVGKDLLHYARDRIFVLLREANRD